MRVKKSWFIFSILSLTALIYILPSVFAAVPGPQDVFQMIGELIITIFGFEWIRNQSDQAIGAFMRFCIWLFVFTLLYWVAGLLFPAGTPRAMSRNITITVAVVIATISTIFIPIGVLIAIGEVYATVVSLIMFGIVIAALVWFYINSAVWMAAHPTMLRVIRLGILFLLWILLNIVTTAVSGGL